MKTIVAILLGFLFVAQESNAQTDHWLKIIRRTGIAVKYFAPIKAVSFTVLKEDSAKENAYSIVKQFSDKRISVQLTFRKYDSHIEVSGTTSNLTNDDLCFTIKTIFPTDGMQNVLWGYDLDSTVTVGARDTQLCNYVDARTVIPPAGAFNTDETHNGGYGDKVGTGQMSFFPLASISSDTIGLGWGVDMGLPIVFRLSYEPSAGMSSECDMAMSKETSKFPNRAFFKLVLFEHEHEWHLRAALEKYYQIQAEYFKKRVPQEGIWLPFAPLRKIQGWKDFGFGVHETNFSSKDPGFAPARPTIEAGKLSGVLTFQYTEPWEEEIPIQKEGLTYERVTGNEIISEQHAEYLRTSAALDKENKYIARKLETPWFPTGWAVSINTNTDPDIKGFNRYDYVCKREINPALGMNVDGIYFDCLEWHWHYDMNYNRKHFQYTDVPLTFSSSLDTPRPVIWSYATEYKFINKVADDMHRQGKYVMGNSFTWIPFAAGILDVFGSELSWYIHNDTKIERLQFARAMADQKPVVFLLNEGMDDKVFTQSPYTGYKTYFDRMLFYGFFPSFFSVDASNNVYWADSGRYNQGRPFFEKYIPLIKEISKAGWQPVTSARLSRRDLRIERFGSSKEKYIYFTVYNPTPTKAQTTVTIDAEELDIQSVLRIEDMIDGTKLENRMSKGQIDVNVVVNETSARLIKVEKK